MSDPNGYQPQGGDQQNNGVSGAAQAPQYTQPAQNYAAPQYTQSQGGYNGQYQDPNAYAQQNYTYAQPPAAYPTYLPRNKYVAAALALFFGIFGLHNFYLGYTGKGVAQVLISVLTFGIGAIAVMIWAIVEAIQILTADYGTEHHRDARGVDAKLQTANPKRLTSTISRTPKSPPGSQTL